VKVLSEKTTHGGVSEEQKGMKWSREAAVEWVKQATGLQVPSAFHFRPDNGRLRPIIRLAGDAGASADAYLRSLLGALGGEEPPSGTAQWVLAWLACASAPTATPADFEELVRSVSPAHHEGPSPRLPGRSADAAHSDSADYAAFSAAAAAAAAHASSTAATSAAAAAADPSAASSSAAAPRTPSGIPLPGTPEGDEEVARALQVDVQDTPARRVTFAERPDDIRRLESQVERLTAMVLALVERSSPPAPQRPSVQRGMEVPPPPPLVDASRVPFGSHHAGAGHTPAPFSAPQPPAPVPAPTQPSQPAQENPFAGQHFSAPSQTEVFQQDPLDALERGSVQSQPALITPGPGLLDPRVWLSYGPVEKSLLLVHIRDIFAEVLNGSQALANDGQHLLHHLSCILHLMDDTSDQEGMVRLAESTLHRMVVLKTALKAGWSVAADLQKGYHEEDEVPAYLRRGFQAMRKADEQPAKPASPPSSGGRGTRRQQEERVSVSVLDRFPPPPRATSGGRALLLEPPLSNGERERLVGKANSYIGDALALSTRRGVHSVYRRFLEFRRHWETRFGTPLDVPTAVVLFVTRLLSREPNSISTSTAVQYVVNIQSAERRLGRPIESQLVRDFIRSLKRAGALRPAKQAVPATKEDVARAVRLETDPVMRLAITLAWQGAARVDDVLTREARNVTESPDFWSVNWVGSKSDPFRLGQVTGVVLPPEEDETLRSLLRSARPGQRIFAGVTFRRVVAALKRSNQALTGHSLRRGALFRLLKMGVDLDTLQRVSRHATQDALVRYLPEAEDVPPPAFLEAIRHHGGIGDAPPSDFTPFVTVAYGGDLIVNELAAPPAQRSSEGYLAPITSSFMDLDRLLAMDTHGLLGGVLDVIRSRESLESALVRDASSWHSEAIARGTSRRMLHHLPDLLKYGVAEVAHEHPRVVLPAFTVPKKSGGERFVCDGRKLNAVMPRPPPMLLPSMPDVIDRVLSSAVVYLADAKSYFYQFELDEGVRGYFGMNLAGPRGSFVRARLRAMCMGWSWAPAIAQRASRVILPETDGLPWVDNFVIVGDSLAEAEERFTRFARRCREVNCVLNDDEGQYGIPLTQFDLLGLRFDLASSPPRYSMATAWVEKLLRSSELAVFRGGVVSPRAFYRLFGALVWFAYTTRFPLAYARCALSFVQRLSSRLSVGGLQAWDVPVNVPASTAREVESLTATIGENRWVTRVGTRGGQSIRLWSDASSKEWAALLEGEPERVSQGIFFGHFAEKHIFLKELFAVLKGLELAVRTHRGVSVELMVDNLPAVHCLNKGHSKNYAANIILSRIFDLAREYGLELTATWVPTHEQRADEYTRDGRTALYLASENGHSEVVKELIAAGAKVNLQHDNLCMFYDAKNVFLFMWVL
ncbi:Gag-Pro-Pol polyprotein, partial [Diplonema papillatum]